MNEDCPTDQRLAPMLDDLDRGRSEHRHGFGAPGHNLGRGAERRTVKLLGSGVFEVDLATPKGLDDRKETRRTVQRAHALGALSWQGDWCRYTPAGTTQSLHIALSCLTRPGDRILVVRNAHEAIACYAVFGGLEIVDLDVGIDPDWDIEHTPTPAMLDAALDAAPDVKAVIVVSPTYFGVTADIGGLAKVAHERGVPLIVDAAWGAAFGFCDRLPANPLSQGADLMAVSVHKTMGALGGGSALIARDTARIDLDKLGLAYELLLSTSPSIPILLTVETARVQHVEHGQKLWSDTLDLADELRDAVAEIDGLRIFGARDIPPDCALDDSKVTIDVSGLGIAGYAVDDWLVANHSVSVGLSDMRRLVVVISAGTSRKDVKALVAALRELGGSVADGPNGLTGIPQDVPPLADLTRHQAMTPTAAFHADAELVPLIDAAGRIAAEIIAPAPPGVPRLIPGQRIDEAHVRWLVANRDAGMFVLDPVDIEQQVIRVVRT